MLERCNLLCAHGEYRREHSRPLGSFQGSFADRFRGPVGKDLPKAPVRSDVTTDVEQNRRRQMLQASLRRASAIIHKKRAEREAGRRDSGEKPSETGQIRTAPPQPGLPADWKLGLNMARSYAGELRKLLFDSCCQLQRDASSVDLPELWRVVLLLRVAEKREKELVDVVAWAGGMTLAHDEQLG